MPEGNEGLVARLERLEVLVGLLLYSEAVDPEAFNAYIRSVLRHPSSPPGWEGLFELLRQEGGLRKHREFEQRIYNLETSMRRTGALVDEARQAWNVSASFVDAAGTVQHLLREEFLLLRRAIADTDSKQSATQQELHEYLVAASSGLDPGAARLRRFVQVRVYLSTNDRRAIERVEQALTSFTGAAGLEIVDDFPEETGSWLKRLFARTKDAVTHPELGKRLKKAERALELAALQKAQAEIDLKQAEAAAMLIKSLEGTPNGICLIGSILVLKVTDEANGQRLVTRSLTQDEMIAVECEPALLRSPAEMLKLLDSRAAARNGSRQRRQDPTSMRRRNNAPAAPRGGEDQITALSERSDSNDDDDDRQPLRGRRG